MNKETRMKQIKSHITLYRSLMLIDKKNKDLYKERIKKWIKEARNV